MIKRSPPDSAFETPDKTHNVAASPLGGPTDARIRVRGSSRPDSDRVSRAGWRKHVDLGMVTGDWQIRRYHKMISLQADTRHEPWRWDR